MNSKRINADIWLVVHIPKAAGTSFRSALEKYFGKSRVIRDYGPHSESTSQVVYEHLYSGEDAKGPAELLKAIGDGTARILVGHFPIKRYAEYFEPQNIITFVREPLVRTCSEYLHRINNMTFEGSFSDFVQRPGYRNLQSRLLEGVSEKAFVGITESYSESLGLINAATQWNIPRRKKNVGRRGGGRKFAENLTAHELDLFYRMNQKDLELYKKAKQQFDVLKTPTSKAPGFLNLFK